MDPTEPGLATHLQRQVSWLKESWTWILQTRVLAETTSTKRLKALDVGCGPGLVMRELIRFMDVTGADSSPEMVQACKSIGLDARQAWAENLPFGADEFDIAYCSFLLLWVKDPVRVVSEMARVSRRWVFCMAEPDIGARVTYPPELAALSGFLESGMKADGGNPLIGRRLRAIFSRCGLDAEIGIHPGTWDLHRLRAESDDEWRWIRTTAGRGADVPALDKLRTIWNEALENGSLFVFSPIFYALADKTSSARLHR